MDEKTTIEAIVYLPNKFYNLENKSMYALLKETGYFEIFNKVTEGDIYNALNQHPSLVNEWMIWSENKQTSSGWYFMKEDNKDQHVVNYLPPKRGHEKLEFLDVKKACAAFIKREIEEIRNPTS